MVDTVDKDKKVIELAGDLMQQRLQVLDLLRALGAKIQEMDNFQEFRTHCQEHLGMGDILENYIKE
jgi:hypothetical protein